jgi:hypothetical protein
MHMVKVEPKKKKTLHNQRLFCLKKFSLFKGMELGCFKSFSYIIAICAIRNFK